MTTVLTVDDSKLARIVVKKAVSAFKPEWRQREAGTVDEALAELGRQGVDVAIVDFDMPGRNGVDLAMARARALGVTFVAKPITGANLRGFLFGADLALRRAAS